jgi:tetratricopeptide (TPR) repeat protein
MGGAGGAFLTVFTWLAISLVFGGVAYRILTAAFEKELQLWEAILLLCFNVILLGFAIKFSTTIWLYIILIVIGAIMLAMHFLPEYFSLKYRRQMWEQDIIRFQKGIDFDAKNVAAYSFLGDTYIKLGRLDEAIESYRKALDIDPKLIEEKKKLEKALAEKALYSTTEMICPRCQLSRPPKIKVCPSCGRTFTVDETISYNLRRTPQTQLFQLFLAFAAGIGLVVWMNMLGIPLLAWFIGAIVLVFAGSVLKQLATWK